MAYFLDSGILLRAVNRQDPAHREVRAAIEQLVTKRIPLFTGLQHLAEFWNVCTRPTGARGGYNLSIDEALKRLARVRRGVHVITETPITADLWVALLKKYTVKGVQVHDCRTVALMQTHSLTQLLTLNKPDFVRYQPEGVVPSVPNDIAITAG